MRPHLSALTTLWIAVGAVCLPALIYLSQGDGKDGNLLIHGLLLLTAAFYAQLFIQSIVAAFCLKNINPLKQYLRALLFILLSPILLLVGPVRELTEFGSYLLENLLRAHEAGANTNS